MRKIWSTWTGRENGILIYLDTQVVVALFGRGIGILSAKAAAAMADDDIRCSPMVRLEMQYLYEIGRVSDSPVPVFDALGAAFGLRICDSPFFAVVREAEQQTWTRDPFDRVIVAQAELNGATLLTKDAAIHAAYARALW